MTMPTGSEGAPRPVDPSGRTELARQWAKALRTTAYVPMSRVEIERLLGGLLDTVFDTLTVEEFLPDPAKEVGQRLVTESFTADQSLSRTLEVLGQALPVDPELHNVDHLAGKVASILAAVAEGYTAAFRARTLDQQERVKQALLKAVQDTERRLTLSEAKFRELFASSAVGIAISALDGTLLETNQALREIVGVADVELAGRSVYEMFHADDVAPLRIAYRELVHGRKARFRLPQRLRLIDKDGEPAWTYLAVSLLHDADGEPTHHVTIAEDVTELHLLGESLSHQSLHDVLTGLPNQQFFISSLERVLGRAERTSVITVCKIDLDGLAVINDGFGREIGDQLLQSVARRLQSAVDGEQATVARFGSDEFAILIENSPTTPDMAAVAARINTELAEPVYIEGHGLAVSACVGLVEHKGGGEPAELLRATEAALHDVKRRGKRQWGSLDTHRDAVYRRRCRLAAAMPCALENGEIVLYYQPMERLADGEVVAIEGLLRWDHSHSGPLPHSECLELAARVGLEIPLGQWLLRRACQQLASWQQRLGEAVPSLHVDLTPEQSRDPDLVAGVRCALEHSGLAAEHLQLGMPLLVLGADTGEAEDNLRVLADMGVTIVLLGFQGVGDVAYLEDLPVRAVEITHRVVQHVAHGLGGSRVAMAVPVMLRVVHCCEATVIARGIEAQDEADWWRSAGADVGQGTFYTPPGAPDEIAALLDSRRFGSIARADRAGAEGQ